MHIPSARILGEMQSADGLVRFVPSARSDDVAFIVKSRTPSIKAVCMGCKLELCFYKWGKCSCVGVIIHDVPDSPLLIYGMQKQYEEHEALIKCIKRRRFPVFFFNEMNVCSAWSYFTVSEEDTQWLIDYIGDINDLYVGNNSEVISDALDAFKELLDGEKTEVDYKKLAITINPESEKWNSTNSYFLSNSDSKLVNILSDDEGPNFENTIWSSLAYMFPDHIYKSPKVRIGNKEREFTDVFSFYSHGSFIIESKDLSVISAGFDRNKDRRVEGIKKQVSKAIKQLQGAVRHFAKGDELLDANNNIITVDRIKAPHCIILITEMMFDGDWSDIVEMLLDAHKSTNAYFHLLDEKELLTLVIGSNNNPMLFDYNLLERFEILKKEKSVFICTQTGE